MSAQSRPVVIGPIQFGEVKQVVFDFDKELGESETIVGTPVVTALAYIGTDATASEILTGSPTVVGRRVVHNVTYKIPGVTYLLRCTAEGSGGLQHTVSALLPCTVVY